MNSLLAAVALAGAALAADQPLIEGNPNSSVRVIVYENLQCSDCAVFRKMLDEKILPKYGTKIAVEHRDFPLARHKWARPAAVASRHFARQKPELAVAWRRYALEKLREITAENFEGKLSDWAKQNGADPAKVLAALKDKALHDAVEAEYQEGVARGIARTPTVLVDGEPFIETFTFEEIAESIERATGGK
jgi:protein-disulfide isomerase